MSSQRDTPSARTRRQLLWAELYLAFWAAGFIARTSFVASDGSRRFSLMDDAMISMRYAWNLAHGQGLVWNPGERVEGYSNLLQTLLMALGCRLFDAVHAVLAVQLAGLVACLATLSALRLFLLRAEGPDAPKALPSALVLIATCLPFLSWPLLGMETGLLALLVTAAASALLAALQEPPSWRRALEIGLLLALLVLTRADGAVLAAALLVGGLPGSRLRPAQRVSALALALLAVVGQAWFRLSYYGDLVPNTARLKLAGMPLLMRVENGLAYLFDFALAAAPLLAALLVAVWRRAQPGIRTVGAACAATAVYILWAGGDAFPRWRFVVPVLPLAAAAAAPELARLGAALSSRVPWKAAARLLPAGAVALTINRGMLKELALIEPGPDTETSRRHVELWLALDRVLDERASLGVLYAGTLPYYGSRWRCVDFLGKVDSHVAGLPPAYLPGNWRILRARYHPGHNKYDLRYSILQRRPTFIETFGWRSQNLLPEVRRLYLRCPVGAVELLLRRGDPAVRWERLACREPP